MKPEDKASLSGLNRFFLKSLAIGALDYANNWRDAVLVHNFDEYFRDLRRACTERRRCGRTCDSSKYRCRIRSTRVVETGPKQLATLRQPQFSSITGVGNGLSVRSKFGGAPGKRRSCYTQLRRHHQATDCIKQLSSAEQIEPRQLMRVAQRIGKVRRAVAAVELVDVTAWLPIWKVGDRIHLPGRDLTQFSGLAQRRQHACPQLRVSRCGR